MILPPPLRRHNAYFVDLFVRASNAAAIAMYTAVSCCWSLSFSLLGRMLLNGLSNVTCFSIVLQFGYSVYRRVLEYYSDGEDALGESVSIVLYPFPGAC